MRLKIHSGFTLVELAVVVFLIGILASLGLSALNAQMASVPTNAHQYYIERKTQSFDVEHDGWLAEKNGYQFS